MIAGAPASTPSHPPFTSPTNLPPLPPSPLLLLLLLLFPVCRPPFFILYFKGTKREKRRNQQRQSSNSTYKHADIIMGQPRRCHDNTQGGEGVRRHRGRDGRKEEVEWVAMKKERRERDGGCYLRCIYL